MRFALYLAICVFLIADILMAQELWGLMNSKGFIREEIFATPTVMKKRWAGSSMKRFNLAEKALHVGLNLKQDELEISSKICKFLDDSLAEIPVDLLNRLEQIRFKAVASHRKPQLAKSIMDQSDHWTSTQIALKRYKSRLIISVVALILQYSLKGYASKFRSVRRTSLHESKIFYPT